MTSEVLPLKVSQVNMADGLVTLPIGSTKSGKGRIVPMTEETRRILKQQLASVETLKKEGIICPYVFHRLVGKKRGQRIKTMRTSFTKAVEAAGLPHRVFHDLRKTGTRDMVRAGNSEAVTMMFTSHTTRAVFDRYNITSMKDMRAAAARMDAYKRKKRTDVVQFKRQAK
jgi:integrase